MSRIHTESILNKDMGEKGHVHRRVTAPVKGSAQEGAGVEDKLR